MTTRMEPLEYETLVDVPLDLDEGQLERDEEARRLAERAEEAIIGDKNIALFWRENRIALGKVRPMKVDGQEGAQLSLDYWDIPLTCGVQSHPECRFCWSRLTVDLRPTRDGRIRDMQPKWVEGDHPVELKTTIGAGIKFQTTLKVPEAEPKAEQTTARTVYFPRIVAIAGKCGKRLTGPRPVQVAVQGVARLLGRPDPVAFIDRHT